MSILKRAPAQIKQRHGGVWYSECINKLLPIFRNRFGPVYWALVSEPGFLAVQISRFSILEFSFFATFLGKSGGEIARKNNKGVLDRPWTKRRVLNAISSTLKFQFTVNPES